MKTFIQSIRFGSAFGIVLVLTLSSQLLADGILVKGASSFQYGRVLSQDESKIVFHVRKGADSWSVVDFARGDVESLLVNIDDARLAKLQTSNLTGYRDYAEELGVQKADPVARELAIRLYLILANFDQGELKQSALAALPGLARNAAERRSFEMLKYLQSESLDLPQTKVFGKIDSHSVDESLVADLSKAVQYVRTGEYVFAANILTENDAFRDAIEPWKNICSFDELKAMSAGNRLSVLQLNKLLKLELALKNRGRGDEESNEAQVTWAALASQPVSAIALLPDLRTVTEFDPAECLFRNGRWEKPKR